MKAHVGGGFPKLSGTIKAQPSKNYTARYLLAAALADGESTVYNVATSDDAQVMERAIAALGAEVTEISAAQEPVWGRTLRIRGVAGKPRLAYDKPINVGNAGAVLRFLLGVGALLPAIEFVTDRADSLGKRPNADLLQALEQLGCETASRDGMLPITLRGGDRLHGGVCEVSGAKSSQFVSSLLFLAPLLPEPVEIRVVNGLVSHAPVRQTIEVLNQFRIRMDVSEDLTRIRVKPHAYEANADAFVNGDWPGSAAIMAAAASTTSQVIINGLFDDEQGERYSAGVLSEMGATIVYNACEHTHDVAVMSVPRQRSLRGVEFNGDLATDAVLALLGAACFAEGRSRFYNVANLRIKECDRISEPIAELRKIGVDVHEGREVGDSDPDAIIVNGRPDGYQGGMQVDGRRDHRVIMLLTIVGLGCNRGLTITGAEHIAKSYPAFFDHLKALGARIDLEVE